MGYLDLRDLAEEYKELLEREQGPDKPLDEDEKARLAALSDLESQLWNGDLSEYAENEVTMIPEEDFEDYAQEFAEDVGYVPKHSDNPLFSYIDWTSWAEDMKNDYAEVTFEDRVYLIRTY